VGIRISPFGVFNDMAPYKEIDETYEYLAKEFYKLGIVYIHIVDHTSMGAPPVPLAIKQIIRSRFKGALILSGGYTVESAESDLLLGRCDLVSFGRPFISNPKLVTKIKSKSPLKDPDFATFYTPGPKGYIDYL
jgi:N-ethylmaleimide reductase